MSLVRVGVKTVLMQNTSQGGGSTITQQLAKNLFPRDINENRGKIARTTKLVVSKLKEWITALKLEYNYTKEEIAAMYLNTVEFGSNAYGIKSAAHTFFNKEPHELNIQEAALLAGLVKGPTMYSPRRNPEMPSHAVTWCSTAWHRQAPSHATSGIRSRPCRSCSTTSQSRTTKAQRPISAKCSA